MSIRLAAIAAMLGLAFTFLLRSAATFDPGLAESQAFAETATWIHLLGAAAMLWFFVAFSRDVAGPRRRELRHASLLAAAGAGIAVLLPLQSLMRLEQIAPFSTFVRSPWLELLAPLVATVSILIFFAVYRRDLNERERPILRRSTSAALAAYALFTILNLIVLALHMTSGQLRWLPQLGPAVALASLPIVAAGLAAVLYFFISLLRSLASRPIQAKD